MRVAGCVCPIIVQQKLNPLVFQHGRAFRLVKLAHCPNKIPVFIDSLQHDKHRIQVMLLEPVSNFGIDNGSQKEFLLQIANIVDIIACLYHNTTYISLTELRD